MLHIRDYSLLKKVQLFFGGIGHLNTSGNMVYFYITKLEDLMKIVIPHFLNYPLLTQKGSNFILFKQIVVLMSNKAHLTLEGLKEIINIKAAMNLGLSELLKSEFQLLNKVDRPSIQTIQIPSPFWITGFVDGEGTFDIKIYKSNTNVKFAVQLRFRISQHERDSALIVLIKDYFGKGSIEKHSKYPAVTLVINNFTFIIEDIIPFFKLYPLEGVKKKDYLDWCDVAKLMSNKEHLTEKGLILIRQIKSGMNKSRIE